MSTLGEDFEAALAPEPNALELWIAGLSEKDRKDLLTYAANPRLAHVKFHRIVKARGVAIGRDRLTEWRIAHGFTR